MVRIDEMGRRCTIMSQPGYAQKIMVADVDTDTILGIVNITPMGRISMSGGGKRSLYQPWPLLWCTQSTAIIGTNSVFTATIHDVAGADMDLVRHKPGHQRLFIPARYEVGTPAYDEKVSDATLNIGTPMTSRAQSVQSLYEPGPTLRPLAAPPGEAQLPAPRRDAGWLPPGQVVHNGKGGLLFTHAPDYTPSCEFCQSISEADLNDAGPSQPTTTNSEAASKPPADDTTEEEDEEETDKSGSQLE